MPELAQTDDAAPGTTPASHALVVMLDDGAQVPMPLSSLTESAEVVQAAVLAADADTEAGPEQHAAMCVIDRDIAEGDVVMMASELSRPGGPEKIGQVLHVRQSLDLERQATGARLFGVPHGRLAPVSGLHEGDAVAASGAVGSVSYSVREVTVAFESGSVCKVTGIDAEKLEPEDDSMGEIVAGINVRAGRRLWQRAKFVKGSYARRRRETEGTVVSVRTVAVGVEWATGGPEALAAELPAAGCAFLGMPRRSHFARWRTNEMALLFATEDAAFQSADPADTATAAEVAELLACAGTGDAAGAGSQQQEQDDGAAAAGPAAGRAGVAQPPAAFGPPLGLSSLGPRGPAPLSSLLASESAAGAFGKIPRTVTTGLCATDVEVPGPDMDDGYLEHSGTTREAAAQAAASAVGAAHGPTHAEPAAARRRRSPSEGSGGDGHHGHHQGHQHGHQSGSSSGSSSGSGPESIDGRVSTWLTEPTMGRRPPRGVEDDRWRTVTVLRTRSYAVVQWQDGSASELACKDLYPCQELGTSEFLPGQFVVSNATTEPAPAAAATTAITDAAPAAAVAVAAPAGPPAAVTTPPPAPAPTGSEREAALLAAAEASLAWLAEQEAAANAAGGAAPHADSLAAVPLGVWRACFVLSGLVPPDVITPAAVSALFITVSRSLTAPSVDVRIAPAGPLVPSPTVIRVEDPVLPDPHSDEEYAEGEDGGEEGGEGAWQQWPAATGAGGHGQAGQGDGTAHGIAGPAHEGAGSAHGIVDVLGGGGTPPFGPHPHAHAAHAAPGMHPDAWPAAPGGFHDGASLEAGVPGLDALSPTRRAFFGAAVRLRLLCAHAPPLVGLALVRGLAQATRRLAARLRADVAGTPAPLRRVGVVLSCDRLSKMATVRWLHPTMLSGQAAPAPGRLPSAACLGGMASRLGPGFAVETLFRHDAAARAAASSSVTTAAAGSGAAAAASSSTLAIPDPLSGVEVIPAFDIRDHALAQFRTADVVVILPGTEALTADAPATPAVAAIPGSPSPAAPASPVSPPPAAAVSIIPLEAEPAAAPEAPAAAAAAAAAAPPSPVDAAADVGVVIAVGPTGHVLVRRLGGTLTLEKPGRLVVLTADSEDAHAAEMDGAVDDIVHTYATADGSFYPEEPAGPEAPGGEGGINLVPEPDWGPEGEAGSGSSSEAPDWDDGEDFVDYGSEDVKYGYGGAAGYDGQLDGFGGSMGTEWDDYVSEARTSAAAAAQDAAAAEAVAAVEAAEAAAAAPEEEAAADRARVAPPTLPPRAADDCGAAAVASGAGSTSDGAAAASAAEPAEPEAAAASTAAAAADGDPSAALLAAVTESEWTAAIRAAWASWGFTGLTYVDGLPPADFVRGAAAPSAAAAAATPASTFMRRLENEYRGLASGLPPGAAAFVFTSDPGTLRLVLAGYPGTPYVHGLFVFDVTLPRSYPSRPPLVHYHCRVGQRLNPNLYAEGKVCLSLLGTWSGEEASETWQPASSTLRQLVLSLQAFVLNVPKPYFNEPGTERMRGAPDAEAAAADYNENALLLSLRSARLQAASPPQGGAGVLCSRYLEAVAPRVAALAERLAGRTPPAHADAACADADALLALLPPTPSAAFLVVLGREVAAWGALPGKTA